MINSNLFILRIGFTVHALVRDEAKLDWARPFAHQIIKYQPPTYLQVVFFFIFIKLKKKRADATVDAQLDGVCKGIDIVVR